MEKPSTEPDLLLSSMILNAPIYVSTKQIYVQVYGHSNIPYAESLLKSLDVPKGICGKKLASGQYSWYCLQCAKNDNAILCEECFLASNHKGHKTRKIRGNGGLCDCGDPDIWDPKGACPNHAGGYSDENKVSVNCLPEDMRKTASKGIDDVMSRLNQCCLLLEGKSENESALQEEMLIIIQALDHLAKEVSPVFLHMIASRFHSYGVDYQTKHACHVRRFDSKDEEDLFRSLCDEKKIDSGLCRTAGICHPCTCTVIENFMRILHTQPRQFVGKVLCAFLNSLLPNRRLRFYMAIGYFANYPYIIPYSHDGTRPLTGLACQFLGYEDVNKTVVECKEYLDLIGGELDRIIANLRENMETNRLAMKYKASVIASDISTFMKEKYLDSLKPFLLSFIKKLALFQQHEICSKDLKDPVPLLAVPDIGLTFEKIFLNMLTAIDFNNDSLCEAMASTFKEAILTTSPTINPDTKVFSTKVHRCLSMFLANYLLYRYWADPDPAKIKGLIFKLFRFKSEAECQAFVEQASKSLLRFVGFLSEVNAGEWLEQNISPSFNQWDYHYEYCLLTILLSISTHPNLLQWTLKAMHSDINVWACIEAVCNGKKPEECWKIGRTKEKLQEILEHSLYAVCSLLSNDIMYLAPIYGLRRRKEAKKIPVEKSKANDYIGYAITKQIVNTYIQQADQSGVNGMDIKRGFPEGLRDVNKIESCLEDISKLFMDNINRIVKFKLLDSSFKLYDPFTYYVKTMPSEEVEHSLNILKRIQDPKKYDYFFGELPKEEKTYGSLPSGAPYIPFQGLLRRQLSLTDAVPVLSKFIGTTELSFVTPWMFRSSFKILLCCLGYRSDELLVRKSLVNNIGKLIYGEGALQDVIEKYKVAICPIELLQEEIKEEPSPTIQNHVTKEVEEQIAEKKKEVIEEFKERVIAFQKKNKTILRDTEKTDVEKVVFICGFCRGPINIGSYEKEPYGKVVHIHKSKVYGYHLNQLLEEVKHKAWSKGTQLGCIPGVTHGLVLTSCGHYLHEKCWKQLLEKPPRNAVSNIDAEHEPKNFLCPLCKACGNNLLTPYEVVEKGDPLAVKQIKEGLMSEMRIVADAFMPEKVKADERFKLICNYINYLFHFVDITNSADFVTKKDCIYSLVYCLKQLIEPSLYDEMMEIKEEIVKSAGFLFGDPHRLFQTDLLTAATQLIVAAKLIESKDRIDRIKEELVDKLHEIIKLAVIQILLAITCANLKGKVAYEALSLALEEPAVAALIKNKDRIVKWLIPFLKKLLYMKAVFFPGGDIKESITKAGWLSGTNKVEVYFEALGVNKNVIESLLEAPPESTKEAFFHIPTISKQWMTDCFKSLLKSLQKEKEVLSTDRWPLLVIHKAGNKKFSLVPLPNDFDDLVAYYTSKPCKRCRNPARDPALCLLCGDILCVSTMCCRKDDRGELSQHANECASGCGLYLRLSNNKVIMVDGGQTCTYSSPYVNKYGESVDISKSHEKEKLTLEIRVLDELKGLYLSHIIPQMTRTISLKSFIKFKPFSL